MSVSSFGALDESFWKKKPLIGMVHLSPLPGSPRDSGEGMENIIARAVEDARALEAGGASAIMIENFFDAPFARKRLPPHTVAALTLAVSAVRAACALPLGVNALRNDATAAIAIAHICGAQFVRINVYVGAAVTDQGIIQGASREAILYRKQLNADVAILADVFVKHAAQLGTGSLEDAARDAVVRGLADGLIVSGAATGSETDPEDVRRVKLATPATPVLVGSGFKARTAAALLKYADGAIVGTGLKFQGEVSNPVDEERVRELRAIMDVPV